MAILRYGNKWLAWGGNLLKMPASLFTYIQSAFSNGFMRNMVLSTIGGHDNALMGSYLLATTNNSITITGFLATDTIWDLTSNAEMQNINKANGLITLQNTYKYGAFEVRRGGVTIGKYCLTERLGTRLINQYRGAGFLPNGSLNGTITNCWQRSNAYYCETNKTGYSIADAGWFADSGGTQALNQYSFIPADLANPAKCLAWVGGVQQDLQYQGYARNNVSLIPISFKGNGSACWYVEAFGGTVLSHKIVCYFTTDGNNVSPLYDAGTQGGGTLRSLIYNGALARVTISYSTGSVYTTLPIILLTNAPLRAEGSYNNGTITIKVTDLRTGIDYKKSTVVGSGSITIASRRTAIGIVESSGSYCFRCTITEIQEYADNVLINRYIPNQHGTTFINTVNKTSYTASNTVTNLQQNINSGIFPHISQGYELWTNGTDYRIYPLADDGTRIITPAGYTLVETIAAGAMPSVADSRLSTVKYSLANSNDLYKSVPEAFNTDATVTPKVLSYNELSALTSNIKVTKTEANGKITNLTIRQ